MTKYNAVLFDLDGTLLDTTEGVVAAVKRTIISNGLPVPTDSVLKTFVGPPMQKTMREQFSLGEEEALRMANVFREYYKDTLFCASLYKGIVDLLKELRSAGIKTAVATNKSHQNAMEILRRFGIMDLCDYAMGSDLEGKLTKADIIERCIQALGCQKPGAVLVGDSIFDLQGAEIVGIDFAAVTYGFGFRAGEQIDSGRCMKMADTVEELKCWLLG